MTKVFIVTDGGHDYSDATKFGEIHFCIHEVLRKDDVSQMYRELKQCFEENASPGDYLLVSSLTSMCMVASAILADMFGEVHLLLHHNGSYVARDLILPSKQPQ